MYSYSLEEQFLRSFIMMYMFFIIVMMIAGIALYVLKSAGLYRMAKKRGMENAWAAWIPYARTYYQGEIAGTVEIGKKSLSHPGIWMLVIPLVSGVIFAMVYAVALIIGIAIGISGNVMDGSQAAVFMTGAFPGFLIFAVLVITLIGIVITAADGILRVFVNRKIYSQMTCESMALFHAAAGLFIPGYEAICIFVESRKDLREKITETE